MPPFVLIWSGWGLGTLAIGILGYLVGPSVGLGQVFSLLLAGALNFFFVRLLDGIDVTRNGRTFTRAEESTLFFMPLHYWTYIFLVLGIGLSAGVALGYLR